MNTSLYPTASTQACNLAVCLLVLPHYLQQGPIHTLAVCALRFPREIWQPPPPTPPPHQPQRKTTLLCIASMLQHILQIVFYIYVKHARHTSMSHIHKVHLIFSLWPAASRREAFVCGKLCPPLWAKLGIWEHWVHNCDSGFRETDFFGKQTTWFLWAVVFPPKKLELWEIRESAQNNASLLRPPRASFESPFHCHSHSSHTTEQACLGLFKC